MVRGGLAASGCGCDGGIVSLASDAGEKKDVLAAGLNTGALRAWGCTCTGTGGARLPPTPWAALMEELSEAICCWKVVGDVSIADSYFTVDFV